MGSGMSAQKMKLLKVFHLIFIMMWTMGVVIMSIMYWKPASLLPTFIYHQQTGLFIDYIFVIPGAICTVITGIIYGLKTNWGFFKYKWLIVKWVTGISIIIIGTFILHPSAISLLSVSEQIPVHDYPDFLASNLTVIKWLQIMSGVQAAALIFLIVISVYKPWMKKKKKIPVDRNDRLS